MNLHQIVSGAISNVNPFITATLQQSTGYTTNADGTRVPGYAAPITTSIQVQALEYNDIAQLDGLNIQGTRRKVYLNGQWAGVIRADQKGGDLLTFPEVPGSAPQVWLVVFVFEQWPDWVSLCVTLQDGS